MKMHICPRCGEPLALEGDLFVCRCCSAAYPDRRAQEMEKALSSVLDDAKIELLSNRRRLLWSLTHENYPSKEKVVEAAKNVLSIYDDDFLASVYLHSHDHDAFELTKILAESTVSEAEAKEVFRWLLPSLTGKTVGPLHDFVDRHFADEERLEMLDALEKEAEKVSEGIYESSLSRDVFLCYSSLDMQKVVMVMGELERNGFSCFAAFRNLRHGKGAQENYLNEIKAAMSACHVIVFLSSVASRSPNCDAMRVELAYLVSNLPEKPRVEYLIEDYDEEPAYLAKKVLKKAFPEQERCLDIDDLCERIDGFLAAKNEEMARVSELQKELEKQRKKNEEELENIKKEAELRRIRQEAEERVRTEEMRRTQEEEEVERARMELGRHAPKVQGETILYGAYPQSEADPSLTPFLKDRDVDERGYIEYGNSLYAERKGKYFLVEPIRFKVLRKEGDRVFVTSETLLEGRMYDPDCHPFETSKIREWLNEDFLFQAFQDGGVYLRPIGADKVSLLSASDFEGRGDGLASYQNRIAKATDYAKAIHNYGLNDDGYGRYWLNDPRPENDRLVMCVDHCGFFFKIAGDFVGAFVRPMLSLRLEEDAAKSLSDALNRCDAELATLRAKHAPKLEGERVLYGYYPQKIVEESLASELKEFDPESNDLGFFEYKGERYEKSYGDYYHFTPIKWRILKREGNKAFAMSEVALDSQPFPTDNLDFQSSELERWLNREFFQRAFPDLGLSLFAQQGDLVSILSEGDLTNKAFGFDPDPEAEDESRKCGGTEYLGSEEDDCEYWIKKADEHDDRQALVVGENGDISESCYRDSNSCVRPCIVVELPDSDGAKLADDLKKRALAFESKFVEEAKARRELASAASKRPVVQGDCLIYGVYPTSLAEKDLTSSLQKAPKDAKGRVELDGDTYVSSDFSHYLLEPIRWIILKKENGGILAMAESLLDVRIFDEKSSRYDCSSIRRWLNRDFLKASFPDGGKALLDYRCDKVSLLSQEDVKTYCGVGLAKAKTTPYCASKNVMFDRNTKNGIYWTKTAKDSYSSQVVTVSHDGDFSGFYSDNPRVAIRPVIFVKTE